MSVTVAEHPRSSWTETPTPLPYILYIIIYMANKNKKTKRKPKMYQKLIKMKQSKKRMTKRQKKQLANELFVNYCKCLIKLKNNKTNAPNLEYPFCASSVYTKRGLTFPKGTTKRCKEFS